MAEERKNAATLRGTPLTLVGPELKPGQKAPPFTLVGKDITKPVTLDNFKGKVKIIASVPSLDTPVCDAETRRFNQEAAGLSGDVVILTVSMDLPFAQARWCGAAGVDKVVTLSDHRDGTFGESYGTLVKGLRLLSRAVFVADRDDRLRHVEYVPEVGNQPNFDAVLTAARQALA
jgi:thiol peroxidase